MQKRTIILILFFVSLFHNVYSQTDVDAVKATLQNMAKAWTVFPKNQDKETILKFYDKNYTESGYSTTVVKDKEDYRYEEFGDGQYAELDNELQEISDKITLGNNIGILFKLGEIKKIEVSGNLAFVVVDFNDIRIALAGEVIFNRTEVVGYILKRTGTEWKILHVSSEGEEYDYDCFPKGSKILLSDGTQTNIENIVRGSKISTYNFRSQKMEICKVNSVIKHEKQKYNLYKLTLLSQDDLTASISKSQAQTITIEVTQNHPVMTNNGVKKVKELSSEDVIYLYSDLNHEVIATSILRIEKFNRIVEEVYNLKIKDNKGYFVNKLFVEMK